MKESIFDTITKKLPKATDEQLAQLQEVEDVALPTGQQKEPDIKDVIKRWQQSPNDADAEYLLDKMKPTINAAMTSYAAGHNKDLAVKAAMLTLKALSTYDPSYGTDPSTHVFHNLKRLNRIVNRRGNIIPVSEQASMEARYVYNKRAEFIDDYGREPSDLELADLTGYSMKKIDKILSRDKVKSETSTLNPETLNSTVASKDVTDRDYFEYVYRSVGPIDQKIMEWSEGAHGQPALSGKEIALKLRITPAAVSQRKAKILKMLSDVRGLV